MQILKASNVRCNRIAKPIIKSETQTQYEDEVIDHRNYITLKMFPECPYPGGESTGIKDLIILL